MKKLLVLLLCLAFGVAIMAGCGTKEEPAQTDTSAAGHPEEMADTTRMDSAMEGTMDTMHTEEAAPMEEEGGH